MFEGKKLPIINGTFLQVNTAQFYVYWRCWQFNQTQVYGENKNGELSWNLYITLLSFLEGIKSIISAKCQVTVQHIQ